MARSDASSTSRPPWYVSVKATISLRLHVETMTASRTPSWARTWASAPGNSPGDSAIFSRTSSGAVWWESPTITTCGKPAP